MRKPWEEEWKIETDDCGTVLVLPDDNGLSMSLRGPWSTEGQKLIASSAPDMARVLLAIVRRAESGTNDLGETLGREIRFAIVDVLAKAGVAPDFALTGDWAERYAEALQKAGAW